MAPETDRPRALICGHWAEHNERFRLHVPLLGDHRALDVFDIFRTKAIFGTRTVLYQIRE